MCIHTFTVNIHTYMQTYDEKGMVDEAVDVNVCEYIYVYNVCVYICVCVYIP